MASHFEQNDAKSLSSIFKKKFSGIVRSKELHEIEGVGMSIEQWNAIIVEIKI